MSVRYDYDPGRLELYRPRADGLMGRCFCGSAVIHLLVGCLLLTVRLPPPPPQRRHYRITEVRLLPAPRPAVRPVAAAPRPARRVARALSPRDLSVFLHDLAPAAPRQRRHSRHGRQTHPRPTLAARPPSAPAPERHADVPESGPVQRSRAGQQLASGLPHLLERPMAEQHPPDLSPPELVPPVRRKTGGQLQRQVRKPVKHEAHREVPAPKPPTPRALRPRPVVEQPRPRPAGGDRRELAPAPRPVQVARAPRPVDPPRLKLPEPAATSGPATPPAVPVAKPTPKPEERPRDLLTGRAGSGKRVAELPGNLFGEGSGLGPTPSRREPSLPEGRPGAASAPGARRPRVSHVPVESASHNAPGDAAGISPVPAPGGVRLSEDERPGTVSRGAPSGLGEITGKGTREASLPSNGADVTGSGSGAAASGSGAAGGYGANGPRAVGGGARPGRPARHPTEKPTSTGDATGGSSPPPDAGVGLGGLGPGAGGTESTPAPSGGHGTGAGTEQRGDGRGKRAARADLPSDGDGSSKRGAGDGGKAGENSGPGVDRGPRSFGTGGRRKVGTRDGGGEADAGKGRGKGHGDGDSDKGGVALPGAGGEDEGPSRDAGDGDSGLKKGRTRPEGVYVSTTGRYTLPGAMYQGDYQYHSRALRKIMDELNSRTKVKVQLGGKYESIAPGSFQRAPVVVFTGHKTFELTEEQRKVLKDYVDSGGMIWADLTHSAFDRSFRDEVEKIFGKAPSALPSGHRIYRSFYVLNGPPKGDFGDNAPFEGITLGDRLGVVITPNRYFSAVAKSLNATDEDQEEAIQAVVNVYMYAVGNYRAVKDAGD
jgi:hypothetical protein